MKNHFGCWRILKSSFYGSHIAISQGQFMLTRRFHDGRSEAVRLLFQIRNAVLSPESLASILKILDVISMPYNTQGVGLRETNSYFGSKAYFIFSVKRHFFFGYILLQL